MISLQKLQLTLGGQRLFDGLDWQLSKGQRVGLVGPNGAGKSTLLKLMCGELEPERGDVDAPSSLSIGYLAQEVPVGAEETPWSVATAVFEPLRRLQAEIEALSNRLATESEAAQAVTLASLEELQARFEHQGGYRYEIESGTVLSGLGIDRAKFHQPMSSFSGGWRARVHLAKVLLSGPDVFLLDEPTNHLDIEALEWLTSFLLEQDPTLVVVSHDRWFLNRICTQIAELSEQGLYVVKGNFDTYVGGLEERARQLEVASKKHAAEASKLSRFIERFGAKASKAKQAKSKMKKLEKLGEVQRAVASQTVHFALPPAAPSDRVLLELKDVGFSYGSHQVLQGVNAVITKGNRIGIVGVNGAGKSTLVNLLCGHLQPTEGQIERSERTRPYLFEQHQIDALDSDQTGVEAIECSAAKSVTALQVRSALGAFGLSGDDAFKRIEVLSGGEKARVALTKALMRPVNLVVLDEPTNHLDMPSKRLLEEALDNYDGTLVVISHDRRFLNQICTQVWALEFGSLHQSLGNYEDYQAKRSSREPSRISSKQVVGGDSGSRSANHKERRRQEAYRRQQEQKKLKPLKKELETVETSLGEVETKLEALEQEQLSPGHHENVDRMIEVARSIEALQAQQNVLYETYGEVLEAIETLKAEPPS